MGIHHYFWISVVALFGVVFFNANVFYSNIEQLVHMAEIREDAVHGVPSSNPKLGQFNNNHNHKNQKQPPMLYSRTKKFSVPDNGLLPNRLVVVVGLESSGTNFVADFIAKALETKFSHERFGKNALRKDTWVQHVSLPAHPTCEEYPVPRLQPVILPFACSTMSGSGNNEGNADADACRNMAIDANYTHTRPNTNGMPRHLTDRFFLDIVSNKEWYESMGVEQTVVIVLRDQNVARIGRVKHKYCRNETLLLREEAFATDIIVRAINKYIRGVGDDKNNANDNDNDNANDNANDSPNHGRRLTSSFYDSLFDETFGREPPILSTNDKNDNNSNNDDTEPPLRRRRLSGATNTLPSGNGVVLVSYESLMRLKQVYVHMIYEALGIESDYMPLVCDGNTQYVNDYATWGLTTTGDAALGSTTKKKQKGKRGVLKC